MPPPVRKTIKNHPMMGVNLAEENFTKLMSQTMARNAVKKNIRLFVEELIRLSNPMPTGTAATPQAKVIGSDDLSRVVRRVIAQTSVTMTRNGEERYSTEIKPTTRATAEQNPRKIASRVVKIIGRALTAGGCFGIGNTKKESEPARVPIEHQNDL